MRRVVQGLDMSDRTKYDEVRHMRDKRVYNEDGTYKVVPDYPVRTLYIVDSKRGAYQRLKKQPINVQNNLIKMLGEN